MVKIPNASFENEIHRVDSPFNKDSKDIIVLAREAGKFRENGQKQGTYCYAN